jgi:hypothetical protein
LLPSARSTAGIMSGRIKDWTGNMSSPDGSGEVGYTDLTHRSFCPRKRLAGFPVSSPAAIRRALPQRL